MSRAKRPKFSQKQSTGELKNIHIQGTYCLVETVISERDIAPAGEQLIILLGFRTTSRNNGQVEVKFDIWPLLRNWALNKIFEILSTDIEVWWKNLYSWLNSFERGCQQPNNLHLKLIKGTKYDIRIYIHIAILIQSCIWRYGRNLENVNLGGVGQESQICIKRLANSRI